MKSSTLIEALSARLGISRAEAEKVIDSLVGIISETLKQGEKVAITNFGCFYVHTQKGRIGVHPRNFGKIQIAPVNVAKFRAGEGLKAAVRQS